MGQEKDFFAKIDSLENAELSKQMRAFVKALNDDYENNGVPDGIKIAYAYNKEIKTKTTSEDVSGSNQVSTSPTEILTSFVNCFKKNNDMLGYLTQLGAVAVHGSKLYGIGTDSTGHVKLYEQVVQRQAAGIT